MAKRIGDAQRLLLEYRATAWRKQTLEAVSNAARDSLCECTERLRLTREIVNILWETRLLGEKLYWVIFVTYMTEREPCDIDEILELLAQKYKPIPRRTYFRLKSRALKILESRPTKLKAG